MMKLPLYLRLAAYLLNIILLVVILHMASFILIPLFYALCFAFLLLPICRKLEARRLPRFAAIFITLIGVFIVVSIIAIILGKQFISFADSLTHFTARINEIFRNVQYFVKREMGISLLAKYKNAQSGLMELLSSESNVLTSALSVTGGVIANIGMIIVYTFLLLLYRSFFYQFIFYVFSAERHEIVAQVIDQIQKLIHSYMLGLISVIGIVAILNSIGLAMLGIESPIFLGTIAALLIIIPYIGVVLGAILPVLVAIVTKDSAWYAVGVMGLFLFVHFLESNFITPSIVGRRVSINPFTAIAAIIIGHAIWGLNGMVLAIPVVAMMKAIFDSIDKLKPIGYLLGKELADKETDMDSLFAAFRLKKKKKA